jgi:RNA polymerase sigma-70 factor (ECF subfamily)
MTDKEKTLLAGCLTRDKAAWDAFVLQYSLLVYHTIKRTFVLYHTDPRSDHVEDLYQEFFLAVIRDDFKKLRQFKGDRGCSLASWVRLVAARLTIDFLRKEEVSPIETSNGLSVDQRGSLDSLIDEEQERLLSQALETLLPRDSIFVDLYYRQGLPPEEMAKILGVSVSAVYTQKSRLQDKLRETLRKSRTL